MLNLGADAKLGCGEGVPDHAVAGYAHAAEIVLPKGDRRASEGEVPGFQAGLCESNIAAHTFCITLGQIQRNHIKNALCHFGIDLLDVSLHLLCGCHSLAHDGGLVDHYRAEEPSVDLFGDIRELALKVRARASGGCEPLVHSEIAGLITGEVEPCDAVALADVHAEVNQCSKGFVADVPLPARGIIVGNFNSHGTIIICGIGTAPATVALVHIQPNPTIRADAVVGTGLSARGGEHSPASFYGQVARHVMDGNLVNGMIAGLRAVRA